MEIIQEHKIYTPLNVINYHIFSFLNLKEIMEFSKVNQLFYKSFKLYLSNIKILDVGAKFNDRLFYFLLKNIKSLKNLEEIKITNILTNLTYYEFWKSEKKKKNKFLSVDLYHYNSIEMISRGMNFLQNLTKLNFTNTSLYTEGFKLINMNIKYLIHLKELTFKKTNISAYYEPNWENYVLYLKDLEIINFSDNDGQLFLVYLVENINRFNFLKILNFSFNVIYFDDAEKIVTNISTCNKNFELILKSDRLTKTNSSYIQRRLPHLKVII
jgi:hypothetical protein